MTSDTTSLVISPRYVSSSLERQQALASGLMFSSVAKIHLNTVPTASNLNVAQTFVENTTLNLTPIVITDPNTTQTFIATLTLSNPSAGSLTVVAAGSPTVTPTFSAGVWTAIGSFNSVNACLSIVQFVPAANFNGNFTIVTSVNDGSQTVTGSKIMTAAT